MAKMKRRDFLKLSGSMITGGLLYPKSLAPQIYSNYQHEWNFREHFMEWMESSEFEFPWPKDIFEYSERIMPLRFDFNFPPHFHTPHGGYCKAGRLPDSPNPDDDIGKIGKRPEKKLYFGSLSMGPKENVDLKIYVSERLDNLCEKGSVYKIEDVYSDVDLFFPIENMENENVFYQVFYRQGKDSYKPFSPPRCFKHPKHGNQKKIILTADTHTFDDRFDKAERITQNSSIKSGLNGEYFYDFLSKSIHDPYWFNYKNDDNIRPLILRNTFHLAETIAYIIKNGEHPDMVIKMGDDLGIQGYRYERQGLPMEDHKGNAEKLWKRERKVWSVLGPLMPIYQTIGNHDGEEGWEKEKTKTYASEWRKKIFRQPGIKTGSSSDEDYYVIPCGDIEFIVLNARGYNKKPANNPEEWTLGDKQMEWYKDTLKRSKASIKFVLSHNLLGGLARNPDGTCKGAYGKGPLFTAEDYIQYGMDPNKIEQVKITDLALKYGVSGIFYGHDHIHFLKEIGINSNGNTMFGMCTGTTNEIAEENLWYKNFEDVYGAPEEQRFLSPPVIEKLVIKGNEGRIDTICTSDPDQKSNIKNTKIGEVLRTYYLI